MLSVRDRLRQGGWRWGGRGRTKRQCKGFKRPQHIIQLVGDLLNNSSKSCGASSAHWNRQYSLERTSSNSKTMQDGCKTPCTMRAVRKKPAA